MIIPSQTLPVRPALWLQLALLAQTNSKFYILLLKSKRTSFVRQKSMIYLTPSTVIELSAMLVAMISLILFPYASCRRLVISSERMVE
jgi:hypothetical protein